MYAIEIVNDHLKEMGIPTFVHDDYYDPKTQSLVKAVKRSYFDLYSSIVFAHADGSNKTSLHKEVKVMQEKC